MSTSLTEVKNMALFVFLKRNKALFNNTIKTSCNAIFKAYSNHAEVKFERPVRQEPGRVRLAVLPEEWFKFMEKKTGVTGLYTFLVTFGTFLVSKEYYVLEHEFYLGISTVLLCYAAVTKLGPALAKYLDKELDDHVTDINYNRTSEKESLTSAIEDEHTLQLSADGQNMLAQAKRENVHLQLEEEYRKRLNNVYSTVKKYLDYQVKAGTVNFKYIHLHMVNWIIAEVHNAITPDFQKAYLEYCFRELENIANETKIKLKNV